MSTPADLKSPLVIRELRPGEHDALVDTAVRAFLNDTVFTYASSSRVPFHDPSQSDARDKLRQFLHFFIKSNALRGSRIIVAAEPQPDGAPDALLASCVWAPPGQRIEVWHVNTLLKSGIMNCLLHGWGMKGIWRLGFEFSQKAEKTAKIALRERAIEASYKNTVWLALAFTDPAAQGRGLIGKIIREGFAHYAEETFTLEASSPKSRAVYAHLGYEVMREFRIGVGKVNEEGFPVPKGGKALGVPLWTMVKVKKD